MSGAPDDPPATEPSEPSTRHDVVVRLAHVRDLFSPPALDEFGGSADVTSGIESLVLELLAARPGSALRASIVVPAAERTPELEPQMQESIRRYCDLKLRDLEHERGDAPPRGLDRPRALRAAAAPRPGGLGARHPQRSPVRLAEHPRRRGRRAGLGRPLVPARHAALVPAPPRRSDRRAPRHAADGRRRAGRGPRRARRPRRPGTRADAVTAQWCDAATRAAAFGPSGPGGATRAGAAATASEGTPPR